MSDAIRMRRCLAKRVRTIVIGVDSDGRDARSLACANARRRHPEGALRRAGNRARVSLPWEDTVQQSGEYRIEAAREAVWRALNDPQVLARCIEGCQSMTRVADDAFAASIKAKVGPVSATFGADLTLTDVDPPAGYTLNASVKGGPAGFGKGAARVTLAEDGGATLLRYSVDGNVGGKLAQVGSRLIDSAARKMADDFFRKFREVVAPAATSAPTEQTPAAVAREPAQAYERSGARIIWIIVFAVLILAIALAV
jgi:uncharacterized protein